MPGTVLIDQEYKKNDPELQYMCYISCLLIKLEILICLSRYSRHVRLLVARAYDEIRENVPYPLSI